MNCLLVKHLNGDIYKLNNLSYDILNFLQRDSEFLILYLNKQIQNGLKPIEKNECADSNSIDNEHTEPDNAQSNNIHNIESVITKIRQISTEKVDENLEAEEISPISRSRSSTVSKSSSSDLSAVPDELLFQFERIAKAMENFKVGSDTSGASTSNPQKTTSRAFGDQVECFLLDLNIKQRYQAMKEITGIMNDFIQKNFE